MVDQHSAGERHWPDGAFWRFSLDLYGRDGVEAACLALQERRGVDVNLMLFSFWLASRGVALETADVGEIEGVIAGFRAEVVQPLRSARRHLRGMQRASDPPSMASRWPDQVERLRERVATLELDGEHLIQLALEEASAGLKDGSLGGAALAAANLCKIAAFEETDRADLSALFLQAFDGLTEPDVVRTLRDAGLS